MHVHALSSLCGRSSRAAVLLAIILFSLVSLRADAGEIVVKNDTVFGPGYPATPKPLPNTTSENLRLGTRLTSPVDGTIVGIQIAWGSVAGTAAPSTEGPLRISTAVPSEYSGVGLLTLMPGATLATIESPTLIDGLLNEFRYLDPATGLVPLSIPVTAGQDFYVDLQYANFTPGSPISPSLPGILMDQQQEDIDRDGYFFAFVDRWVSTSLGVSDAGNFGIRAIIQPVPEPSTWALAAIGMVAVGTLRRRKRPA